MTPGLACILFHVEAGLYMLAELHSVAQAVMPRVAEIGLVHRLTACRLLLVAGTSAQGTIAAQDEVLLQSSLQERRCGGVAPDDEVAEFVEKFAVGGFAQHFDVDLLQDLFLPIEVQVLLLLNGYIILF